MAPTPLTVAVVGCGPSGMFICHHVEERRRKLLAEGKIDEADQLPMIQCFEKASGPGGNWRADRVTEESLWTNGPKELLEFFDYTFADHYGVDTKLPCYLTRAAVLEYIMARVTRHAPDLLEKHAQFNTEVLKVDFSEETKKFSVETKHVNTGERRTATFDRCIWAAGESSNPKKPKSLLRALKSFAGVVMHSSEVKSCHWAEHVTGKHLMLIGGSFSAEDIGLMAIKQGVQKITIVIRHSDPLVPILWANDWPHEERVVVMERRIPVGVNEQTQAIRCAAWDIATDAPLPDDLVEVEGVDTVVLCTGYAECYDVLEDTEYNWDPEEEDWYEDANTIKIPNDWKMAPNPLSEALAHVEAPSVIEITDIGSVECFHDCVYGPNPGLMYATSENYDFHVLALDVMTYLMVSVMVGDTPVPTTQQIIKSNREMVLEAMNNPYLRTHLDATYEKALRQLWKDKGCIVGDVEIFEGYGEYFMRKLAQAAKDGHYPVDLGSFDALSATARAMFDLELNSRNLNPDLLDDITFRDLTAKQCALMKSVFTGNVAAPFKARWLTLDDSESPTNMVESPKNGRKVNGSASRP